MEMVDLQSPWLVSGHTAQSSLVIIRFNHIKTVVYNTQLGTAEPQCGSGRSFFTKQIMTSNDDAST